MKENLVNEMSLSTTWTYILILCCLLLVWQLSGELNASCNVKCNVKCNVRGNDGHQETAKSLYEEYLTTLPGSSRHQQLFATRKFSTVNKSGPQKSFTLQIC